MALPLVIDIAHFLFLVICDLEFQVEDHVMFVMLSKKSINEHFNIRGKNMKINYTSLDIYTHLFTKYLTPGAPGLVPSMC